MSSPFLFLDRDDTLIYDHPYLRDPAGVELTPGAGRALKVLQDAGFQLALVTNQSGIARGLVKPEELECVHARLRELLREEGVVLAGIFLCPHGPWEECDCRKPRTGMLRQACAQFEVDLTRSAMIGDRAGDIEMGRAFGLTTVQIRLNPEKTPDCGADVSFASLAEAVPFLLKLLR
ncbi:MAG: HAD family hydrolase [Victivallales bacterium]|nr:HAD family hydrolase [Victivallales bacterium]